MLKNKSATIFPQKFYSLLIPLLLAFVIGLPVADIAHAKVEKVSQELGAQGKGNAYGLQNKDKETTIDTSKDESYYTSAALSSATSAAPLPPVPAILALVFAFGLKTFRNKRGK